MMNDTFHCCYNCDKRHMNCHSECPEYIQAKEETAKENKKRDACKLNMAAGFRAGTKRKRGQI